MADPAGSQMTMRENFERYLFFCYGAAGVTPADEEELLRAFMLGGMLTLRLCTLAGQVGPAAVAAVLAAMETEYGAYRANLTAMTQEEGAEP